MTTPDSSSQTTAPKTPAAPPAKKELKLHVSDDNILTISDGSGGIVIKNSSGAMISVGPDGITLDNGQGAKLTLVGPKVTVNDGALEVI